MKVIYRFRSIRYSVVPVELSGQLEEGHYVEVLYLNYGVKHKADVIIAVLNAI